MNLDNCLKRLAELDLLPREYEAAFVVGSVARGWENSGSDLDIYLVTREPWTGRTDLQLRLAAATEPVPAAVSFVDERRWEVKYWLDSQIDSVIDTVSPARFDAGEFGDDDLVEVERLLLARIPHAVALDGARWLTLRSEQIHESAFRVICVTSLLNDMDKHTEDAVGLLEAGDLESAVISAKSAFRHGVDALLAGYWEMGGTKWRARAFRAVCPKEMSFSDYWSIETMADFDQADPRNWVEHVLSTCQQISMAVEI